MSPVATKRVHWEDDSSRYAAPSPFYVTLLVSPVPLSDPLPHSPAWSPSSPRHRLSPAPRPCLRPPSPFPQLPPQRRSHRPTTSVQLPRPSMSPRAPSPSPRPRRHSISHPHDGVHSPYASTRTPLPSSRRLSIHRVLRLGTCQPIDFFSSSRIVPHPHVASDPASNPPLGRVYILVEIDKVERFNVEVHAASGGIVTVHDVIARMQSVLRERLKPEVVGGCYKEGCGCGCGTLVDKRSHFTTMFDGLSVRLRSNGEENKWRMHLRRVRYRA